MPPPRSARKNILYTLITVLIAMVAVELGLHLIDFAATRLRNGPDKIPFRGLYAGKDWAAGLARESDSRGQVYEQYLTWTSRPQKGRFVNLDPQTGRQTWNPPDLKPPEIKVFVFGGSAAWGYGARDDETLPSQLSRLINAKAPRYRVYNFGEPGYTFTQGVFSLITKLREGARPDYVIFYDGFNDVYGAYQSGKAGTLHNLDQLREKLEKKPSQIYRQAVKSWLQENVFLYSKVVAQFSPQAGKRFREKGAAFGDQELQALAAGLVQYYAQSLALLDHLAQTYGFKYACFWQPALFTETRLLPQEVRADVRLEDQNFARLYQFANQYLAEHPLPNHFHNLTDVLQGRTQPGYLDLVHLTEEGYGVVAKRLEKILRKDFALGD